MMQSCWLLFALVEKAAVQQFVNHFGYCPVAKPYEFLRCWKNRETSCAAARSGRPPIVAPKAAERCARRFMAGWADQWGRVRGFKGVTHAISKSPTFAELAAAAGGTPPVLLAAMKRACPEVGKVTQRLKPVLTAKQIAERRAAARLMRYKPRYVLKSTEWLDEAGWGMSRLCTRVYGDTRKGELLVEDNRAPRKKEDYTLLHFAVSVNWTKGPHSLVFLSGTRGLSKEQYEVGKLTDSDARDLS